jgi:hypothetical protein
MAHRTTRLFAFLALACGSLILAGTALAVQTPTTVTIVGPDSVYGYVHSTNAKCLVRKVKIFKQKGSVHNPAVDKLMTSTTSERQGKQGKWDLGNPGFPHGKYYAEATSTSHCQSAFSKTISVP